MKRVTDFLVNHCYVIFGVFLVLTIICGFLYTKVKINKDIYSYLPADSETAEGLDIMDSEFDYSATSSYEMMLEDVPESEKDEVKSHIESVDGVKSVEYDHTENYNKDQYTLYKITIDAPADSETANSAYHEIHDTYKEKYTLAEAGQVRDFNGEVLNIFIAIFAVACAMVILIAMSESWVEPWLFLFSILLAVVVNSGTNIIFPSVSHITNAISAVLQMALSMDYAIMLSTRYRQEKAKKDCKDKYTAMRRAMRYSFGAISSSSVTTVVGLIVLIFMSFTIGKDMGLVLSKGVVFSLVSIFTSLPALLLLFDKAIEKTAKKSLNFKMTFLAKQSYHLRHFALPLFLFIFISSFLLKGSTAIDFTAEQNNKIKKVFPETNQMVILYDANQDVKITELCHEYDAREDTVNVSCYGNTINEPEKYDNLIPKINLLSDEPVNTENYLVKAIYYHYYRDASAHLITLPDLVTFLQTEVFPSERFRDDLSPELISKVDRFSNFVIKEKAERPRTKAELASILEIDPAKLDDVFTLYFSTTNTSTQLTLNQFARFVSSDILTNPQYASMLTASQKSDLGKLLLFSDSSVTDTPKSIAELSEIFGIDQSTLTQILVYYGFITTDTPTVSLPIEDLLNFALSNDSILKELNLTPDQASEIKDTIANARSRIDEFLNFPELQELNNLPEIQKLKELLEKPYSYDDYENLATAISSALDSATSWLDNLDTNSPDFFASLDEEAKTKILDYASTLSQTIANVKTKLNLDERLAQLKSIYKLYQAESTASSAKVSPRELVSFLLDHAEDEKLSSAMTDATISRLRLVQYIINHQTTRYTAGALANAFNLDAEKLKLVYALYYYRYINNNPSLSLKTLIYFINDTVLPNPEYADKLGASEKSQLETIATLMRSAENGVAYSYESLYRAILPLSDNLDKNQLFLAYLYHGSLYDYDESWTLTLEQFINFLAEKVLPDTRFANRLDDETRQKITDGQQMVADAHNLLIGPKHYRALIETHLPAEGSETFAFISELRDKLGPNDQREYYLVGDSAMAYEMSQSFSGEMDFITILTMLAIFAVVLCTFKSFFVSLLLVLVIQCAVYIVMAYLSLTGSSIYFIALIIVQAILMGATIDYAILFTSYYTENRTFFKLNRKNALLSTYRKSTGAILTSASILIIVTAIVGNFTNAIAGKICQSISLGTFCATIIILILLPALLATLDRFIVKKAK